MKKSGKTLLIVLIVLAAAAGFIVWGLQDKWYSNESSKASFRTDNRDMGNRPWSCDRNHYIHYTCNVSEGTVILEITDVNMKTIREEEITDYFDQDIRFNRDYDYGICFIHVYAKGKEIKAHSTMRFFERRNNFQQILYKIKEEKETEEFFKKYGDSIEYSRVGKRTWMS